MPGMFLLVTLIHVEEESFVDTHAHIRSSSADETS